MTPEITVVGSLNLDLVVRVQKFPHAGQTIHGQSFQQFCGGKGANQAFASGRLGGRVAMVGQVGADDAGKAQISNLTRAGVNTNSVGCDPQNPSGTAIITVEDSTGQNQIIVVPGANGSFSPEKLSASHALLAASQIVLLQLEIPFNTVRAAIQAARPSGAIVMLDPAPAPDFPLLDELLRDIDYLTPNSSELAKLTGQSIDDHSDIVEITNAARLLCRRGVKHVIAKLGERGALLVSPQDAEHVPGFSVPVQDTTAAGDCFNAAFAVALTSGRTGREAARFANAAAACSVTRAGAQASMPTLAEVETLLRSQSSIDL